MAFSFKNFGESFYLIVCSSVRSLKWAPSTLAFSLLLSISFSILATFAWFFAFKSFFSRLIFATSSYCAALILLWLALVRSAWMSVFFLSSSISKLALSLSIFSKRYFNFFGILGFVTRIEMILIPGAQTLVTFYSASMICSSILSNSSMNTY